MKFNFGSFFKNMNGWVICQYANGFVYEREFKNCSKTEILRNLEEEYYPDEVYFEDILSTKIKNADMKKSDFRKLILENKNRFGKTIKIGKVLFNQGQIYNPNVNDGNGYQYVGSDADERTVNSLWRLAKIEGVVSCGENDFYLI